MKSKAYVTIDLGKSSDLIIEVAMPLKFRDDMTKELDKLGLEYMILYEGDFHDCMIMGVTFHEGEHGAIVKIHKPDEDKIFTEEEFEALKGILTQWIDEGFEPPPYKPVIYKLIDKLGIMVSKDQAREAIPANQKRGVKMKLEDAKRLLELSDTELAGIGNRYKYEPKIHILDKDGARSEAAPDWAKGFLNAWSDITSTHKFLKEQLGVTFVKDTYSGHSDGGYHPHYASKWGNFDFYGNYYRFECFIPVLRWALTKFVEEKSKGK